MSDMSRSRRRTSCWMISRRRSREALGAGERQRFDGASERCQRILQFVADVGGKAFDRIEPRLSAAVISRKEAERWPISSPREE